MIVGLGGGTRPFGPTACVTMDIENFPTPWWRWPACLTGLPTARRVHEAEKPRCLPKGATWRPHVPGAPIGLPLGLRWRVRRMKPRLRCRPQGARRVNSCACRAFWLAVGVSVLAGGTAVAHGLSARRLASPWILKIFQLHGGDDDECGCPFIIIYFIFLFSFFFFGTIPHAKRMRIGCATHSFASLVYKTNAVGMRIAYQPLAIRMRRASVRHTCRIRCQCYGHAIRMRCALLLGCGHPLV